MSGPKKTLEDLKKEYHVLMKKYPLPSFEELNANFSIERVVDIETDFLLREIRKCVGDKLFNYLRFVENLLNPINASMFIFSLIKSLGPEEKRKLSEVYKKLSVLEIKFIKLDLSFNEEKEVEFIKEANKEWCSIRDNFKDILERIEGNLDNKSDIQGKGYLG
ncbi:MAG: hypothetical protein QXU40_00180 [Candidatus Pacearchaeota archaeon]